jgi:3-hydroxyacyl-CoA dehydrogenase / enoyl-CoA hydratase / 3-hydroxybutyryl-CoA epimerase
MSINEELSSDPKLSNDPKLNTDFNGLRFFSVSWRDGVCVVSFDVKDKALNSFSEPALNELSRLLDDVLSRPDLSGLVFLSGKKDSFAAGVDISIFATLKTAQDGEAASRKLQTLFARFETAKVPTVAAIHGVCLGGGLELSLAMKHRVCTSHKSTQMGLPEVQLGLLPGGGGTQRLPRLIGIAPALDLILTGKKIDGKKAARIGLVDDCVPESQLLDCALDLIKNSGKKETPAPKKNFLSSSLPNFSSVDMTKLALESNALGRSFIEKKSQEQIEKNTKGFYPAPKKCLDAVIKGMGKSLVEGLAYEAKLFGELVASKECSALIHIFEIMTAAKKNPFSKEAQAAASESYVKPPA